MDRKISDFMGASSRRCPGNRRFSDGCSPFVGAGASNCGSSHKVTGVTRKRCNRPRCGGTAKYPQRRIALIFIHHATVQTECRRQRRYDAQGCPSGERDSHVARLSSKPARYILLACQIGHGQRPCPVSPGESLELKCIPIYHHPQDSHRRWDGGRQGGVRLAALGSLLNAVSI
jgi:hypothetical protein